MNVRSVLIAGVRIFEVIWVLSPDSPLISSDTAISHLCIDQCRETHLDSLSLLLNPGIYHQISRHAMVMIGKIKQYDPAYTRCMSFMETVKREDQL